MAAEVSLVCGSRSGVRHKLPGISWRFDDAREGVPGISGRSLVMSDMRNDDRGGRTTGTCAAGSPVRPSAW